VPSPEPIPLSRLPHGEAARLLTFADFDPASGVVHGRRDGRTREAPLDFFPDCLLIELMAQTAGLGLPEGGGAVIASIPRVRLHRAARAEETIDIEARRGRRLGSLFTFDCRATTAGELLAEGEIVLRAETVLGEK